MRPFDRSYPLYLAPLTCNQPPFASHQVMGIEKMTLLGHSMGAYVSAVYTMQHPDRVSPLPPYILIPT